MNEKGLFTRRKFIIGSAATLGGVILSWTHRLLGILEARAQEPALTSQIYLPLVARSSELAKPRVVHVRDASATNWNGTGLFYNAVDQDVVNNMVQTGLQFLTGQDYWPDIRSALFERVHPGGYSAGQKIAISKAHTYDYLLCAEEAGLGVCEGTRSDPGGNPLQEPYGSGYDDIEYIRVDYSNKQTEAFSDQPSALSEKLKADRLLYPRR